MAWAAKGGKKTNKKGKASNLADANGGNAPRTDGVYVAGMLAMIGVMVAASAGVMYQRKTTAALDKLVEEVAYLREAEVYDSDTTSTADDGDTASTGDFNMQERMFREFEIAKAHMGATATATEATMLLDESFD